MFYNYNTYIFSWFMWWLLVNYSANDKVVDYGGDCGLIKEQPKCINIGSKTSHTRIVGGCSTNRIIPWFVQILIKPKGKTSLEDPKLCGGTLINKFWVLSAAHCFCNPDAGMMCTKENGQFKLQYEPKNIMQVHIARPNLDGWEDKNPFYPLEVVVHPEYVNIAGEKTLDFALFRLSYPIADNAYGISKFAAYSESVMPICLPDNADWSDEVQNVTITGLGQHVDQCFTNPDGPEVYRPCARVWNYTTKSGVKRHTGRKNCRMTSTPSELSPLCKDLSYQLRMTKSKAHNPTEMTDLYKGLNDASEVVVIPKEQYEKGLKETSSQSGVSKDFCFLKKTQWCATCDDNAKKGEIGYCENKELMTDYTMSKGWGYCDEVCNMNTVRENYQLQVAQVTTLSDQLCKQMMTLDRTENNAKTKSAISVDVKHELCAGHITKLSTNLVTYTNATDGSKKFEFEHVPPTGPENTQWAQKSSRINSAMVNDQAIGGVDSCNGDSGGPMWKTDQVLNTKGKISEYKFKATLVGVVSRGRSCALFNRPGIYGRVKTILEWIKATASTPMTYKKINHFPATDCKMNASFVCFNEERLITPYWEEPPNRSTGQHDKAHEGRQHKKKKRKKRRKRKKRKGKKKKKKKKNRRRGRHQF